MRGVGADVAHSVVDVVHNKALGREDMLKRLILRGYLPATHAQNICARKLDCSHIRKTKSGFAARIFFEH
jgi:hypothetical protein